MNTKAPDSKTKAKTDGIRFVRMLINGVEWDVASDYMAPLSIGEAVTMARLEGCELPTPSMVDAIWSQAVALDPAPMRHDGTYAGMNSPYLIDLHKKTIDNQKLGAPLPDGMVWAGHYKDVCRSESTPLRIGLYGWHRKTGKPIQPFYAGHALSWRDYSQGLRLCRRVTEDTNRDTGSGIMEV